MAQSLLAPSVAVSVSVVSGSNISTMDESSSHLLALDDKSQSNSVSGIKSNRSNQSLTTEKSKLSDYAKKAIKQVTEYNQSLNQQRREQRAVSMDLQTYTINYPVGLGVENKILRHNAKAGRVFKAGKYPVAVMHGQYTDWYIPYTSEELNYFPLNTVIFGPVVTDPSKLPPLPDDGSSAESDSDSEDDDDDDDASCSSRECRHKSKRVKQEATSCDSASESSGSDSDAEGNGGVCKTCHGTDPTKASEQLIQCSDCGVHGHISCLELTPDMVEMIKSYRWQCMQCKTCVHCKKAHEEDKMIICDICDRGYHTFCVGLRALPTGKWICSLCAQCCQCGSKTPGDNGRAEWQHETIKIISPNGDTLRRHQLLCQNCYKQRKNR